ncbi:MAG: phosphopentomutase [Verrucomicrobiales bacterium]
MRAILIVLDSVGVGQAPDAADYGDAGCATLQHIAETVGGLNLPTFYRLGLGNVPMVLQNKHIQAMFPNGRAMASFGAMQEVSQGKDTITGHWELAGLELNPGFHLFPKTEPSFPKELTDPFVEQTGRPILGNRHGSGTAIIEELGEESMQQGAFIVYTSADSVFQIAAHTDVIPLEELYAACEKARALCDPFRVGRVIARPFTGVPGSFERTKDRVDYAFKADEPTILEHLKNSGIDVYSVGKIEDIFAHRGITEGFHTGGNPASMEQTYKLAQEKDNCFIFANFIDFDMLYGHRRDPFGYADCLAEADDWFSGFLPLLGEEDLLIVTADHGNDPTFTGTDHTREYVPLLVYRPGQPSSSLGVRLGFYDVAQSLATFFGVGPMPRGTSFL